MTPLLTSLGIIGLGQIGASLALAARKTNVATEIFGFDSNSSHHEYCLQQNIIDQILSPEAMATHCQLIIIAVPPAAVGAVARDLLPHLGEDTILTDVASVKMPVLSYLEDECPEGIAFIPGHPIAGGTVAGPQGANGNVFARKLVILTPPLGVDVHDAGLERVRRFWEYLDMVVELMPADVHDLIYGHVSHLPHLIAYAACACLADHALPSPLPESLRRFLRLGDSDPALWTDIVLHNQQYTLHALRNYLAMISHIRSELAEGKDEAAQEDSNLAAQVLFPRIAASCLIATVSMLERQSGQRLARYSGAGFADISSPAAEAPEDDLEQISLHYRTVGALLRRYEQQLEALAAAIEGNQPKHLLALLSDMQAAYRQIHPLTSEAA